MTKVDIETFAVGFIFLFWLYVIFNIVLFNKTIRKYPKLETKFSKALVVSINHIP